MNYKNLHIILAFIAFALVVLSSPIINDESSVNESDTEEEIIGENSVAEVLSNGETSDEPIDLPDITNAVNETNVPPELNESVINPEFNKTAIPIENPNTSDEICDTPECQEVANKILSNLNRDVDPCEDFYEYACGNYGKNSEKIDGLPEDSMFITLYENTLTVKESFEEGYKANEKLSPEEQEYDKKNFEKVLNFYNSCMNTEIINAKGVQPLLELLNKLEINENRDKYNGVEDLTNLLVKLSNINVNIFFKELVFQNLKNAKNFSLYLGQPGIGLPYANHYEDPKLASDYKGIMKTVFTKVFENQKERNIDNMVENIFEFEKKLLNILENYGQPLNKAFVEDNSALFFTVPNHVNENIESLNKSNSFIDWKNYFNNRYENLGLKGTIVNDDSIITVITPGYFEKLNSIIKETNSTIIADYAEWNVIKTYSHYLSSDVRKLFGNYLEDFISPDGMRDLYCIFLFNNNMSMGVSKVYVDKVFGEDDKKNIDIMIKNIRETMNKKISELPWLDDITRENALKKASSLTHEIGYPDFVINPKELYEYYEGLEIDSSEFLNNIINNVLYENARSFKQYKNNKQDQNAWIMASYLPNAYNNPTKNSIIFPAGILKSPFYSSSYPDYLNYGNIGVTIGHELSHGFDNNGRLFDYEGKFVDWWTNSTSIEFQNLSQCFVEQYSKFYLTDKEGNKHNVDGNNTLGENIGDNSGISRGYEAWKLSLEKDPKAKENNKSLPGLSEFTHDQLFFIYHAQDSCNNLSEEEQIKTLSDEHPPSKFRLLGTLSNSEYFAKAFNCKINTPMNPEKKCKIW
ncbi:zincin [Anaeromyces robustus]|uniref:Zincin n=1 Tax=Anaeromyces robustus TaxID=1754192 RepID=A0A1Y1WQJ0_9FUNG|nr:zincin [Anaeromyces robustus]|eukprot:ORX75742.1 zincin [Anaeromyces robustus]